MNRLELIATSALLVLLASPRSAAAAGPAGAWDHLQPAPPARPSAGTFDQVNQRMVVVVSGAVWTMTAEGDPTWQEVPTSELPASAQSGTIVHDPLRNRLLLFGGSTSETWELSLSSPAAWSILATDTPTLPQARRGHSAVFDAGEDRMIVVGGYDGSSYPRDVWALRLSGSIQWELLGSLPGGVTRHFHGAAVHEQIFDRLVIYGGSTDNGAWSLPLDGSSSWTRIAQGGPGIRSEITGMHDPIGGRLIVFGGVDAVTQYPPHQFQDVWSLRLYDGQWSDLGATGTPPYQGSGAAGVYDPTGDRLFIHGYVPGSDIMETRSLPLSTRVWDDGIPEPRDGAAATFDSGHHRMILFGGYAGGQWSDELWSYETGANGGWRRLDAGPGPSPREEHSATYDPVRDRTLVFGGRTYSTPHADLWALENTPGGPMWQSVDAGPGPDARWAHTVVYDAPRNRMVLFGGYGAGGRKNDVWSLSLGATPAWTQLSPSGAPPIPRYDHAAIYDDFGDRMIVWGGQGNIQLSDAWALQLSGAPSWTPLAGQPHLQFGASAIVDPVGHRMILVGRAAGGGPVHSEAWELSLHGPAIWAQLAPSGVALDVLDPAAAYDPDGDRMLLFDDPAGLGAIRWNRDAVSVGGGRTPVLGLDGLRPNPARVSAVVAFTLPDGAPARLEMVDVAGRRVMAREVGMLGAGRHQVELRVRELETGIYWIRLTRAGEVRVAKAAIIR